MWHQALLHGAERAQRAVRHADPGEQVDALFRLRALVRADGEDRAVTRVSWSQASHLDVRSWADGWLGEASTASLAPADVDWALGQARDVRRERLVARAEPLEWDTPAPVTWDAADVPEAGEAPSQESATTAVRATLAGVAQAEGVRARSGAVMQATTWTLLATSGGQRAATCQRATQALVTAVSAEGGVATARSAMRDASEQALRAVGADAARRAIRNTGATPLAGSHTRVLLTPDALTTVLGRLAPGFAGDRVTSGSSWFAGLGIGPAAAATFTLADDGTLDRAPASRDIDDEGVACQRTPLIVDGQAVGALHDRASARASATSPTGNSFRDRPAQASQIVPTTLVFEPTASAGRDRSVVEQLHEGLVVEQVTGFREGIDALTGRMRVGVAGCRVRDGAEAEPYTQGSLRTTAQELVASITDVRPEPGFIRAGVDCARCWVYVDGPPIEGSTS